MPYSLSHHPLPSDFDRDAIHVPIIKVTLQHFGYPGIPIHVAPDSKAYRPSSTHPANAVVDPFKLGEDPIPPNTIVWAFFIPQNIRLTHIWEHDTLPLLAPTAARDAYLDADEADYLNLEECRNCY